MFINYLENDPGRSTPAWGWLLAFGLFVSNVTINIVSGIIWSISTTTLQSGIRLQLNTLLFAKTLAKKDIAASTEQKSKTSAEDKEKKEEEKDDDDDDEGVSSKTQIMTLFTVDVDRVTDFIWHQFALIDAPLEIAVATLFLLRLLGTSALFGLLATVCELLVTRRLSAADGSVLALEPHRCQGCRQSTRKPYEISRSKDSSNERDPSRYSHAQVSPLLRFTCCS